MEYQKNLLDNTTNQPSKFRTKYWVEINHESRQKYDTSSIKFKTSMTRPDLCHSIDAYIFVSGTITITGEEEMMDVVAKRADKREKGVIF